MQVRFTFLFLVAGFLARSRACAQTQPLLKEMDAAPLVLIGGTILPFPDATPIPNGVVVIESGKITAFGRSGAVIPPSNAATLDCRGDTIVAGFWNCHVHFTERKWADVAH